MREEEAPSPAVEPTEEEDAAQSTTKRGRHRVLACATLASIINAFMFMNFSPIVELSRRRFRATEGQVSWLYSAALLATLPCFFAGATRMSNADTQRGAILAIHVLNAVAALLRLAAVARASYAAAVASSLALGAGTSLVVASSGQSWIWTVENSSSQSSFVISHFTVGASPRT